MGRRLVFTGAILALLLGFASIGVARWPDHNEPIDIIRLDGARLPSPATPTTDLDGPEIVPPPTVTGPASGAPRAASPAPGAPTTAPALSILEPDPPRDDEDADAGGGGDDDADDDGADDG